MNQKILTVVVGGAALSFLAVAAWFNSPANKAVSQCHNRVVSEARFPSKAAFDGPAEVSQDVGYVGGMHRQRVVEGRVDLMNGIGNMIPHRYRCEFDQDDNVRSVTVTPG